MKGIIIGVVVILLVLGGGLFFLINKNNPDENQIINGTNNGGTNSGGASGDWCSRTGGGPNVAIPGFSVSTIEYVTFKNERRCHVKWTSSSYGTFQEWYVKVDAGFTDGRPKDYWNVQDVQGKTLEYHYFNDKCVDLQCSGIADDKCQGMKSIYCP